jgi:hypothetical protein
VVWSLVDIYRLSEELTVPFVRVVMEVVSISEKAVNVHETTRLISPEDSHLLTRRRENLKSRRNTFDKYYSS